MRLYRPTFFYAIPVDDVYDSFQDCRLLYKILYKYAQKALIISALIIGFKMWNIPAVDFIVEHYRRLSLVFGLASLFACNSQFICYSEAIVEDNASLFEHFYY